MTDALAITELSMSRDISRLDLISNNLANATTTAFKRDFPVVRDFDNPTDTERTVASQKNISGVHYKEVIDFRKGAFKYSGNPLDIAIEGDGFLEVQTTNGIMYSRQGTLTLDSSGRLTNTNGYVVNGVEGDIRLRSGEPFIDKQGKIWEGEEYVGQLKITVPRQFEDLEKLGEGLYQNNGVMQLSSQKSDINVRQGYVETSNVNTMNEMVQMMATMRHFELGQKLVKAYDEMLETAMNKIGDF